MLSLNKSQTYSYIPFIAPWLIGFLCLFLGPLLASFYLSFTNFDGLNNPDWINFANYKRLITDPNLLASLKVTFSFAFWNLVLGTSFAICMALLLKSVNKASGIFRSLLYIPTVVPLVASSVTWIWIFKKLHEPSMLSDPKLALPALIIISMWSLGNPMIIYLAGLQNIPQALYEAADIDAASEWQKFWHISLPSLSPVILFNLVIGIIQVFQYFVPAYVMTSGGPKNSTLFYSLYIYQKAFEDFEMGYASALAWVLFLIILFFTWLAFRLVPRD
ncbi:MAG: sugar ABC transporter permease [Candidatus Caenarcaniphilales bacterium]|nr:sugar ABC transporter permease [Candidatus Caenarcaniphilales bacterium]